MRDRLGIWWKIRNFVVEMKLNVWISKRLRTRRGARASTRTGVVIAVAGVALAVAIMELCVAIATGFKGEIRHKIFGFDASVAVLPPYDTETQTTAAEFSPEPRLWNLVEHTVAPARAVAVQNRQAILKTDSNFVAVQCVGYGSGHDWAFVREHLVQGSLPGFPAADDSVVISTAMSRKLQIGVGDRVMLYFFDDGNIKARRRYVAGLYSTNFGEYDDAMVYASYSGLSHLRSDTTIISAINIEGIGEDMIMPLADTLQSMLIEEYQRGGLSTVHPVNTVYQTGMVFFNWLDLLDTNVVVVFILMLCVAALTMISSLFIIILDRVSTIGILRAIGATRHQVSEVFVAVAMRLVMRGMLIGNCVGIGLILLQTATHWLPLDPQMYYIAYVPMNFNLWHILAINAGFALASWLIVLLPSRLASRIDPSQTVRYE